MLHGRHRHAGSSCALSSRSERRFISREWPSLAKTILQGPVITGTRRRGGREQDGRITSKSGRASNLMNLRGRREVERNWRNWLLSHPWRHLIRPSFITWQKKTPSPQITRAALSTHKCRSPGRVAGRYVSHPTIAAVSVINHGRPGREKGAVHAVRWPTWPSVGRRSGAFSCRLRRRITAINLAFSDRLCLSPSIPSPRQSPSVASRTSTDLLTSTVRALHRPGDVH